VNNMGKEEEAVDCSMSIPMKQERLRPMPEWHLETDQLCRR